MNIDKIIKWFMPKEERFHALLERATQNLLLAARALGYGGAVTMWFTSVEERLREVLGVGASPLIPDVYNSSIDWRDETSLMDPEDEPDVARLTDHHEVDLEPLLREAVQLAEPIAPRVPALVAGHRYDISIAIQIILSKYAYHLPLYRQSQILARYGVRIDRSTLAGWVGAAAAELQPLHDRLLEVLFSQEEIRHDLVVVEQMILRPFDGREHVECFVDHFQPVVQFAQVELQNGILWVLL